MHRDYIFCCCKYKIMCRKKISLRLFELDRISDSCMLWMIRKWKEVGQVIFFVWCYKNLTYILIYDKGRNLLVPHKLYSPSRKCHQLIIKSVCSVVLGTSFYFFCLPLPITDQGSVMDGSGPSGQGRKQKLRVINICIFTCVCNWIICWDNDGVEV